MPISQGCDWKWIISRTLRRVVVGLAAAVIAFGAPAGPAPRPQSFGSLPAPSSFLLVVAGLAGLVGWNWWRGRSRAQQNSRD